MTRRQPLAWLAPGSPPDAFPDPRRALRQPNGLLAAGGDLTAARLLAAYRRGIFPWYSEGEPILWWCPDPRAILVPAEFHISRRLARTLRSGRFEVSVDQSFGDVIRACASAREETGTWLTAEMIAAYSELHALGVAHSIETWRDGKLAGGVYGINLGGVFFGESMVSLVTDGSKVALAKLVRLARRRGIELIDCQVPNDHLARLGSRAVPRIEFLAWLERCVGEAPEQRLEVESRSPASEVLDG
jgi:leucyl/phenylalanyl-tRNA--protein transferase